MPTLTLPQLVAGREIAAAAVGKLGPIDDADVVVDARALASGTSSFAAQLVRSVLVEGRARQLTLLGGPTAFRHDAESAAASLGVAEQLTTADAETALAS
jgi:hypothetical protein